MPLPTTNCRYCFMPPRSEIANIQAWSRDHELAEWPSGRHRQPSCADLDETVGLVLIILKAPKEVDVFFSFANVADLFRRAFTAISAKMPGNAALPTRSFVGVHPCLFAIFCQVVIRAAIDTLTLLLGCSTWCPVRTGSSSCACSATGIICGETELLHEREHLLHVRH